MLVCCEAGQRVTVNSVLQMHLCPGDRHLLSPDNQALPFSHLYGEAAMVPAAQPSHSRAVLAAPSRPDSLPKLCRTPGLYYVPFSEGDNVVTISKTEAKGSEAGPGYWVEMSWRAGEGDTLSADSF